jgi:hypothetical protein
MIWKVKNLKVVLQGDFACPVASLLVGVLVEREMGLDKLLSCNLCSLYLSAWTVKLRNMTGFSLLYLHGRPLRYT